MTPSLTTPLPSWDPLLVNVTTSSVTAQFFDTMAITSMSSTYAPSIASAKYWHLVNAMLIQHNAIYQKHWGVVGASGSSVGTANPTMVVGPPIAPMVVGQPCPTMPVDQRRDLPPGTYELPGGAQLVIDADQSYRIIDDQAKVTYRAAPFREFNEYVNVSDVLEQFMRYIATLRLSRGEFMALPIRLFMLWLIIEAAKRDQQPPPEDVSDQFTRALNALPSAADLGAPALVAEMA